MSQPIDFVRAEDRTSASALLPTEFEHAARRRLMITMLLSGAVFLLYLILFFTVWYDQGFWTARVVSMATVALCFGGAWVLHRGRIRTRGVHALTFAFEVALCLSLGLMDHLGLYKHEYQAAPSTISWTCVVILLFPLLAPMPARLTALAAFSGAVANGLTLGVAALVIPEHIPETGIAVSLLIPPFICAACAIIPARVVAGLGAAAQRAKRLGSYQLEERIGEGGMGEVWRASHAILKRPAAVKLIKPERGGDPAQAETLFKRFRREALVTASLRSPHTVEVYDFGTTGREGGVGVDFASPCDAALDALHRGVGTGISSAL